MNRRSLLRRVLGGLAALAVPFAVPSPRKDPAKELPPIKGEADNRRPFFWMRTLKNRDSEWGVHAQIMTAYPDELLGDGWRPLPDV